MEIMSFFFLIYAQQERFVRTVNYADRYIAPGTKVALDNNSAIHVSTKCPVRASYYACPTADTPLLINGNPVTRELFMHRACKTRVNTPGLSAVATLDRKRNLYISVHTNTRQRTGSLSSECFDGVLRFRVLYAAIDFAQSTANADILLNIYPAHAVKSSQLV
jgi:hypothetical protein